MGQDCIDEIGDCLQDRVAPAARPHQTPGVSLASLVSHMQALSEQRFICLRTTWQKQPAKLAMEHSQSIDEQRARGTNFCAIFLLDFWLTQKSILMAHKIVLTENTITGQ